MDDKAGVEDVLKEAKVIRLAMCRDGKPYVVPMNFGYQDGVLYLHSAPRGTKFEILRSNPDVCFEADIEVEITTNEIPCKWGAKYRSVIGFGKAGFIEDVEEKKTALEVLMSHYGGSFMEFAHSGKAQEAMDRIVVIKVPVDSVTLKERK